MTEAAEQTGPNAPTWGLGDVGAGAAVALVGGLIAVSIALGATGAEDLDHVSLTWVALTNCGLWAGFLGAPLLAARRKGSGVAQDFGFRARRADLLVGGAVGVVLQVVVLPLLYWPLLALLDKDTSDLEEPARLLSDRAHGIVGPSLLVLTVGLAAPVIEELFYRGLFQRAALKRGIPPALAVIGVAVLFAAAHQQPLQFPGLLVFGLTVGWLAHRYDRLGPSIATHVAFNMVTVVALLVR